MATKPFVEAKTRQTVLLPSAPTAGPRDLKNYRELVARTVDVFGDELKASRWLSLPSPDLNGETPIQVAQRHRYDVQSIEPILTRIEFGIDY